MEILLLNDMNKELEVKPAKLKILKMGSSNSRIQVNHQKQEKNIVWLAYQQGKVFEKFKENARFIDMVNQFGVSKYYKTC